MINEHVTSTVAVRAFKAMVKWMAMTKDYEHIIWHGILKSRRTGTRIIHPPVLSESLPTWPFIEGYQIPFEIQTHSWSWYDCQDTNTCRETSHLTSDRATKKYSRLPRAKHLSANKIDTKNSTMVRHMWFALPCDYLKLTKQTKLYTTRHLNNQLQSPE